MSLPAGRGSGDGRLSFFAGDGRFETGIDDKVEDVGGPEPASLALEDRLTQAFTVVDDAVAAEVAEGGLGVEHVF